jgi:hypothetical protein
LDRKSFVLPLVWYGRARPEVTEENVGLGSMLSKKYFPAGGLSFPAPLARPTRAKVRDHIES